MTTPAYGFGLLAPASATAADPLITGELDPEADVIPEAM